MTLLEAMAGVLESNGFPVEQVDDLLRSGFEGPAGFFGCIALTVEEQGQVVFYAVRPTPVPAEQRADVAVLCAHESSRLAMASVEVDRDHGQVRVRSSLDLASVQLSEADLGVLLDTLVRNTIVAANHVFALVDAELGGN